MSSSNKAAKSGLIIISFTLISKFLGFVREVLIASKFGNGAETDTFFIALGIIFLATGLLRNVIGTTFIPIISEIEVREGKYEKNEYTNNIIHIIILVSILIILIALFSTPFIIKIFARGFEGEQFNLAVKLTRIGLPMILFSGAIGVFTAYLQSEGRFLSTAATAIPYNLVYVFFLIFLSNKFGIKGLMVVAVVAIFSQFLIQIPEALSSGYRYKFKIDLKDKYVKRLVILSGPAIISSAMADINAIVDKTLASSLTPGSISALNYADKLNGLILGVFIYAITTVIFPLLSKESNKGNIPGMKEIMKKGVNLIFIITVPATVGLIVLSTPIVEVAFERGEFDVIATAMTAPTLVAYSISLIAKSLRLLVIRLYYSLQDTKSPMVNGGIALVFNIVISLILVQYMDHVGLALATSISTIIASILLILKLKKRIGSFDTIGYIKVFMKTALASAIMGLAAYLIYNGLYSSIGHHTLGNLMSLFLAVGVGAILYGVLCYVFKVEEVRDIVDKVLARIKT